MTTPSLDSVPPLPAIPFPLEIAVRRWLEAEEEMDRAQRSGDLFSLTRWGQIRNNRLQRVVDLGKPRIYGV